MKILFLDDSEERADTVKRIAKFKYTLVKTAKECIEKLNADSWDLVSLDHDLGDEVYVNSNREDCGMEVVRWIEKNKPVIDFIVVHTYNEPAGKTMYDRLRKAGYHTEYTPFSSKMITALNSITQ